MSYNILTIIFRVINRQFDNIKKQAIRFTKLLSRPYIVINKYVRDTIRTLTNPPSEREDYVQVGHTLFSKRSLFLALTAVIITGFLSLGFLYPMMEGNLWIPKINLNSGKFFSYAGKAKVVNHTGLIIYYGEIKNGNANGEGIQFDTDGNMVYSGTFATGQYQGFGNMYDDGNTLIYSGQFAKNLYDGVGRLYTQDGKLIYDGEFKNGLYNGSGIEYYNLTGNRAYDGNFSNGYREGKGVAYSIRGTEIIYVGDFSLGKYSGIGSLYDNEKLVYTGAFKDGMFSGEGTLYYPDAGRPKYRGQFLNSLPHGAGELYDPKSFTLVYSGSFVTGERHGMGVQYDSLGYSVYNGMFKDDSIDYKAYIGTSVENIRAAFGPDSSMVPAENKFLLVYKAHNAVFIAGETKDGGLISETLIILPGASFLNINANMTETDVHNFLGEPDFSLNYQPSGQCQTAFTALNTGYRGNSSLPGDKYLMDGYYVKVYYSAGRNRIVAIEMGA